MTARKHVKLKPGSVGPSHTLRLRMDVSEQAGDYQPAIHLTMGRSRGARLLRANLYRLAASIELATPDRERWVVRIDPVLRVAGEDEYDTGRVWLELYNPDGDPEEATRGHDLLKRLLEQARLGYGT